MNTAGVPGGYTVVADLAMGGYTVVVDLTMTTAHSSGGSWYNDHSTQ